MADFDYKRLLPAQALPVAVAALVTNPDGKRTYVHTITMHNPTDSAQIAKLYDVAAGGAAGPGNQLYEESIDVGETRIVDFPAPGIILEAGGDAIYGECDAADAINIRIMGGEE